MLGVKDSVWQLRRAKFYINNPPNGLVRPSPEPATAALEAVHFWPSPKHVRAGVSVRSLGMSLEKLRSQYVR